MGVGLWCRLVVVWCRRQDGRGRDLVSWGLILVRGPLLGVPREDGGHRIGQRLCYGSCCIAGLLFEKVGNAKTGVNGYT